MQWVMKNELVSAHSGLLCAILFSLGILGIGVR